MARLFLTFSGLGIAVILFGQAPLYTNYEHYDTEDGLPQIYVTAVVQDEDGFIWVATQDGIARFDGREFTRFGITSKPPHNISTPRVLDFWMNENNQLHILHFNKKVDIMDTRTFVVTQDVPPVKIASYGDFKLSTGHRESFQKYFVRSSDDWHVILKSGEEYHMFDSTDHRLMKLFSEHHANESVVYGFDVDERGRLWLVTSSGLEVSDEHWKDFRRINIPPQFEFETGENNFFPIVRQSGERVFFAIHDRFFVYHESDDVFLELTLLPFGTSLPHTFFNVAKDQEGRVLFEYQGIVFRLEEDNSISTIWEYPGRFTLHVDGIFMDKTQTLWVGINTGGLYRVNMQTPSFNSRPYRTNFLVDILTDHLGVSLSEIPVNWNKKGWAYDLRYFLIGDKFLISNDGPFYDRHRRIFYLNKDKLTPLNLPNDHWSSIRGIAMSGNTLFAVDSKAKMFTWSELKSIPEEKSLKLEMVPDFNIVDMSTDSQFQWILEARNQLFQIKGGEIIKIHHPGDLNFPMITLQQDQVSPEIIWIGTYGGGLIKWRTDSLAVEAIFREENGLADNIVAGIVPDQSGNLWLSTFNGISKFNTYTSTFTNYNKQDGLIESEFNRHHEFLLSDGRIALGGTEGYSIFNPSDFMEDDFEPEVMISRFWINDELVSTIPDSSIFSEPINHAKNLALSYDQNSIALEMAAMQYNDPNRNHYRYRLAGFNGRWVETETNRSIRFDNLPPGRYTLLLNASNTNGKWSSKIREISIRVYPPPWLSWWAYSIYILIIFLLVYIYWKSYKKRLISKQEEAFNRREAERLKELDNLKTQFFSNITHEFRTPLTLILSPLEKHLKDNNVAGKTREILKSNFRHGKKLLDLVNQLLDISKLESGHMQSHQSMGELGYFLNSRLDEFSEIAMDGNIQLTFTNKNLSGHYLFDKTHWEKIIQNLLSNAIKFTSTGGKVMLEAEEVAHEDRTLVKLTVQDTGIGIEADKLPKLFDRFYQADDTETRVRGGTGIGLSLVKELTDLLEGSIEVESEVGKGSTFRVMLPAAKIDQPIVEQKSDEDDKVPRGIMQDESSLILVVEDNEELRSFIVESLSEKYKVLESDNGKGAWEIIKDRLPDIVVSDVMMPGINGVDLCQMTKEDIRTAHIGFIILTAKSAQESKIEGLEAGADEYLTKPFHFYELELRITNLVQQQINQRNYLKEQLLSLHPQMEIQDVKDAFLLKLYDYLETHLKEPGLGVESVAVAMAMSRRTLNRKLHAMLNISANELIRRYRLQRAVALIQSGESISRTAYEVGFESPSYFSTVFKGVYGKSPSEYQKFGDVKK